MSRPLNGANPNMFNPSRILRDPYLEWVEREGIPVVEDFGVNLFDVQTGPWPRIGAHGAAVHLKGRGDFMSMFVIELKPGAATSPQRHLYEETIYVLAGHGSTTIVGGDGKKYSFEWGLGSLFAIPLNATFQHFNVSGIEGAAWCAAQQRLRLSTCSTARLLCSITRGIFPSAWVKTSTSTVTATTSR